MSTKKTLSRSTSFATTDLKKINNRHSSEHPFTFTAERTRKGGGRNAVSSNRPAFVIVLDTLRINPLFQLVHAITYSTLPFSETLRDSLAALRRLCICLYGSCLSSDRPYYGPGYRPTESCSPLETSSRRLPDNFGAFLVPEDGSGPAGG